MGMGPQAKAGIRATRWGLVAVAVDLLALSGCGVPDEIAPAQLDRGYVAMLPGVEGSDWQLRGVFRGLRDAGLDGAIEVMEWGDWPMASLRNLTSYERNRRRAKGIADRLAAYGREHPERPITLIGYSGGGGVALFVAEALPDDVRLHRLILVAAAISPAYDLTRALARCDRLVSFHSTSDWLLVGVGTRVFGTIDRQRTVSAGFVGFLDEAGAARALPRLEQVAWRPAWLKHGHYGGHIGYLARPWARAVLARYVMGAAD